MKRDEIIKILQKIGLTEYESKAYVALTFLGIGKAGEISKEAGIPQSKIYQTLENLVEKQLVEVFDGRPKEYRIVNPRIALSKLLKEKEEEIRLAKKELFSIMKLLKPQQDIIEGIWIQKGEKYKEVLNRLADMLNRAREYVYDITRDFSYTSSYRKALLNCKKRGVKIHVIGIGGITKENYYRVKWYFVNGIEVRIFKTKVHPRILVVDGREVAIRLDHDPLKRRFSFHSIWSQDPSLVSVMDNYLKHLWEIAEKVDFEEWEKTHISYCIN